MLTNSLAWLMVHRLDSDDDNGASDAEDDYRARVLDGVCDDMFTELLQGTKEFESRWPGEVGYFLPWSSCW
jgi:hypothetical protein